MEEGPSLTAGSAAMIMPIADETNLIFKLVFIKSFVQTSSILDFLLVVKVIVMLTEFRMNPKNSKDWVGVSTDFFLLMLNPNAWRREAVLAMLL